MMSAQDKILYVDDEKTNLVLFEMNFKSRYNVITAESGEAAISMINQHDDIKVIISDNRMPKMSGVELLCKARDLNENIVRIILTAYMDINSVTDSINKAKVFGYIYKPYHPDDLLTVINNAIDYYNTKEYNKVLVDALTKKNLELNLKKEELEREIDAHKITEEKLKNSLGEVEQLKFKLQEENTYLLEEIKFNHDFHKILTKSKLFLKALGLLKQVAPTNSTVLIMGETGTGKELIARAIHDLSNRASKPLIKINCASLPELLIESELFGHEKGAFTGALQMKKGKFELADTGTIFLDEIGEMPISLQAKLLRVLQENEFDRIGGVNTIKVNVRVIAATNRNLQSMIAEGKFREDLFYRLNVFPIETVPLRDRPEDVQILVEFFVKMYSEKIGKRIDKISEEALEALQNYTWPGNVRELENTIERGVIVTNDNVLKLDALSLLPKYTLEFSSKNNSVAEFEKEKLIEALYSCKWKIQGSDGAANKLRMAPSTLRDKMKKYKLERPDNLE